MITNDFRDNNFAYDANYVKELSRNFPKIDLWDTLLSARIILFHNEENENYFLG